MGSLKVKHKILTLAVFCGSIVYGGNAAIAGCSTTTHQILVREPVAQHISDKFTEHREWVAGTFLTEQILPALMLFTEQMTATAMQQTMSIGMFLDAKHQLETQRLLQTLQYEAHKDYQPSEDFCWFGTNVRSLAATEQKGRTNYYMLNRRQLARRLGEKNMGGATDADNDKYARWLQFLQHFCDPQDSNWADTRPNESGLASLCDPAPASPQYTNADIDYTSLIDAKKTISPSDGEGAMTFDFTSGTIINSTERAVTALQNNLYGHEIVHREQDRKLLAQDQYQYWNLAFRSVIAKRSVAENSYNAIVGLKSAGTPRSPRPPTGVGASVWSSLAPTADTTEFLGAILTELGVPPADINQMIGVEPSYYAQLELLAKKIYQNPDFYANLYDKPANVKRKSVALRAIELLVERAIYESQIRQEMVTSVLLSARLNTPFEEASKRLVPPTE